MPKLFMYGTDLQELEQMMMVPNLLPKRSGMIVVQRIKNKPELLQRGRRSKWIIDYCESNPSSALSKQIVVRDISCEGILVGCFEERTRFILADQRRQTALDQVVAILIDHCYLLAYMHYSLIFYCQPFKKELWIFLITLVNK